MEFQQIKALRNEKNLFCKRLGISIEEISPGFARVVKTVEPEDLNPLQIPHGGVYFTLADTACGSAAASHGRMGVTTNCSYNFLRSAAVGDTLTAEAREVKAGKTICVYEARVTNQENVLLGTGTFTFFLLDQKIDF